MKKRSKIWRGLGILIVALALVIGGLYFYKSQTTAARTVAETPVQTATVRRGNLVVSATGAPMLRFFAPISRPSCAICSPTVGSFSAARTRCSNSPIRSGVSR